ncbi:SDR family oxidoreductase [Erythrobacter sp.]|uniref:SDR family oxidoreductase n=1 Tax=Erythrobacter sp. TaxID=1042 RepID=UPI003C7386B1
MARPAILVTGGATRIGARIVRRFAREGWQVVIHYRSSHDAAHDLARQLPSAETIRCDLADDDARKEMVLELAGKLGDWRCLVNSASIFRYDDMTALDPETNQKAMHVNAFAPAHLAQLFFAHAHSEDLRCVIDVTDMKVENPNPDFASYTMSKNALASTIVPMAIERRTSGHERDRVYGLAPGAILPSHDQDPEETEVSHRLNLLRRKTGADEIADAAWFLAGGALKSGSSLFVDSGQHLLQQDRDVIWLARDSGEQAR